MTLDYLQELTQDLAMLDREEQLQALIELGKELPYFSQENKVAAYKVPGCVSGVYIKAREEKGKIYFSGDADSLIVKGYVAILVTTLSGLTVDKIIQAEEKLKEFIEKTNILASLVATRADAFGNIFVKMLQLAKATAA